MLSTLFGSREPIIGLDIGAGSIKLIQLDLTPRVPALAAIGTIATPIDAMQGHFVKDPERLAQALKELLSATSVTCRNVALAVPASSVFVKAVKIAAVPLRDLPAQVRLEAAQFIPYDMNSIALDFHVVGKGDGDLLDVLVVAIKREVLAGYLQAVELAGLVPSVVDVDAFALQNCFEYSEAAQLSATTALIDVGARFSVVNVVREGRSVCLGDIPVGVHTAVRVVSDTLGIGLNEAEKTLTGAQSEVSSIASTAREQALASLASDLHKHVSLLSSSGDEDICVENARLAGGGAMLDGLQEHLGAAMQCSVSVLRPFAHIVIPTSFSSDYLSEVAPLMGVSLGLALRCPGDEIVPELMG